MEYNKLPGTNIKVSKICLGTMTWGVQNSKEEAFDQMDYSLDNGINFFDTAELYPVPASAETYATTEKFIGEWLVTRKSRDKIILASKIAGPGDYTSHIRKTGFKGNSIDTALENSLKRRQKIDNVSKNQTVCQTSETVWKNSEKVGHIFPQ